MNSPIRNADLAGDDYIPEIEQEVLGALLVSGQYAAAIGVVRADHFLEPVNRRIYENILIAIDRYKSSKLSLVSQMFQPEEKEAWAKHLKMPLSAYLAQLSARTVYGHAGLPKSIPNLLQQWARISLKAEAIRIAEAANDAGADPAELIRTASRQFDDIAAGLRSKGKAKTRFSIVEAADAAILETQQAIDRGHGITGITWGLTDVNKATGGIQRGEMVVLGARPSMGKTAFGLGVAIKAAKSGAGVGFFSLEMGSNRLAMRALSDIAFDWNIRVPYSNLISGNVADKDFEAICAARNDFAKLPLWIEEQPGLSITDLRMKFERMQDAAERGGQKVDVLVVDYLGLIAASSRYAGNRVAEVTEISAGLRQIARENDVAMIALSQLSRGIESRDNKRPNLSDLRDSGSIEQDADTVMFLYREAYYLAKDRGKDHDAEAERLARLIDAENKLELIISKQRNGEVKTIDLFVDIACSAVRNAARM